MYCITCLIKAYCALLFIKDEIRTDEGFIQCELKKRKDVEVSLELDSVCYWPCSSGRAFTAQYKQLGSLQRTWEMLRGPGTRHIATYKGTRKATLGFNRDC